MPQSNFIPRRKRSRGVNSVLHIFCEGATEEAYFEAYKRKIHCAAVVIEHSHHGDPKGLVAEAIKAKRRLDNVNQVLDKTALIPIIGK